MLGYEVVGTVKKVGQGVNESTIGKRVTAFTRFGGYAEFAITQASGIADIGDMDAGKATGTGQTIWHGLVHGL